MKRSRAFAFALVEVLVALAALAWVVTRPNLLALLATCLVAVGGGMRSMLALLPTDHGTFAPALASLAKAALLLAPVAAMLQAAPRRRLAWIPILLVLYVIVLGTVVPGVTGTGMWILFGAASGVAVLVGRRRWLGVVAFLPWLIALAPATGHGPLADVVWPGHRLIGRCATNDGQRPVDLQADVAMTRYYGVTPTSPELMLLTGERHSFWVRRAPDGTTRLGPSVGPLGNLWQGCLKGGRVWVTKRAHACVATPPTGADDRGTSTCFEVVGPPEVGPELDYTDVLCSAPGDNVYLGQLVRGGIIEFDPATLRSTWHPVMRGMNMQLVPRADGLLVGITTSRLFVFDARSDRVVEEQPAGMVAMGIDLCPRDDAVAVTDLTGRVRLFDRTSDGEYRFHAGASLPAPRRVAFSPSCERLIVTSGDDRHAFLLRRTDLSIVRSFSLGPGLRDVTFIDEKTVAAVDGCTVNLLDGSP